MRNKIFYHSGPSHAIAKRVFGAHIRLENFRASVTVFLPMARLKKSQHVADSARTRHRAAPLFTSKPSLETAERIPA
jgi:hypothetical protein